MADTEPEEEHATVVRDAKPRGSKARRTRGNRPSPLDALRALASRFSRLRILVAGVLFGLVLVVGTAAWFVLHGMPSDAKQPAAVARKAVERKPEPLPSDAPSVGPDLDPKLAFPFARRLHDVNALAHKRIVTAAEYHRSDAGQMYYTAVVTSCKELDALWPIRKGVLHRIVQQPLRLKTDFPTFAFVQHDSAGQWGVVACDDTV